MFSENRVPIEAFARIRLSDGNIVLRSDDPLMLGWEAILPPDSAAALLLKEQLAPEQVDGERFIEDLVEGFLASGASAVSYAPGIIIQSQPFSVNRSVIPLASFPHAGSGAYVGLETKGTAVIDIQGNGESGRSSLVARMMSGVEVSVTHDFATVDLSSLPASTKRNYGESVVLSFLRNSTLRYLVLDHYSPLSASKRHYHPAVYNDMLKQILNMRSVIADSDKTLVMVEGAESIPSHLTTITIELVEGKGYRIGDIYFPL